MLRFGDGRCLPLSSRLLMCLLCTGAHHVVLIGRRERHQSGGLRTCLHRVFKRQERDRWITGALVHPVYHHIRTKGILPMEYHVSYYAGQAHIMYDLEHCTWDEQGFLFS